MAGIFTDAINTIAASLTALGLKPVTDPRNARPLTVFIELPSFESFGANPTSKVSDVTITIRILGAPPGNQDSTDYILQIVDKFSGQTLQSSMDNHPSQRSGRKTSPVTTSPSNSQRHAN
jgi:hypothetical protein